MTTIAEGLRAAKARIDTPDKWWDGRSGGNPRTECAVIAVAMVGVSTAGMRDLIRALRVPEGSLRAHHELAKYNDTHTHAELMALFDRAIEIAEAR